MVSCSYEGCKVKSALFNLPTETKGLYCSKHKINRMIDVVHKTCHHKECNKIPNFNLPTKTNGLYCLNHKLTLMVNVSRITKCLHVACNKQPNFNLPTETKGLYCSEHKLSHMIDVKNRSCFYKGCNKQPNFNLPTETKGLYCSKHKLSHMIDVKNGSCLHKGCNKIPVFNIQTETKGIYCSNHKLNGMLNIIGTKCLHAECNTQPYFNLPTETKGLYCSKHKLSHMIDVKNGSCLHKGCNKIPVFNIQTETKGIYCSNHKLNGMLNVKDKKCQSCNIYQPKRRCVDNKVTYMCSMCFHHNFPNEPRVRKYLMKERYIVDDIKKEFGDEYFQYNKQYPNTNIKPDLFREYDDYALIIEIDEDQHIYYDKACERNRMTYLYSTIGKPVKIIRFNSDSYEKDNKKIRGCFLFRDNKLNIYKNEYESRLNKLVENIKKYTDNSPDKEMCIDYMFYDT
jgi:hypothetical protein